MKNIAIITGASGGLGRQLAFLADKDGYDELWLIARNKERLESVKSECETEVRVIPGDLTDESVIQDICSMLEEYKTKDGVNVKLLINNAGYGRIGAWNELDISDCGRMIELNCKAAVLMTQTVLPYMQKGSGIMNICSTAAFQPFPYLNVYAATKAFLYRYSRALRMELLPKGIRVTAVCPYWIKDTEFIKTAGKNTTGKNRIRHFPLAVHERGVARTAMNGFKLGLPVVTTDVVSFLHRIAAKVIPSEIMMWIWEILRRV